MAGEEGLDRAKMKQYLVPAVGVAAVVLLVALVAVVSNADARKMSDGSDGSADDPDLKQITSGVKYRDVKEGTGDPCPPGAEVKMKYTGWLPDGGVFDSGTQRFKLAELITGWQEGIPGMKRGGIRKLVVSPSKGYGSQAKGKIPANSTLIFEVELIDFTPGTPPPRPRRSPDKIDLTKLSDGTAPGADDPGLKPLGGQGLMYRDLKVGDGPECPPDARVVMDYAGWLTNGSLFDSSWNPGQPRLDMPLRGLIKGWQQGVPGMKVGGVRKLVIPPQLAYGDEVKPGIPANSTLVFEIELLGIKE
jgi:peptidylprolyl isomerase